MQWLWIVIVIIVMLIIVGVPVKVSGTRGRNQTDQQLVADRQQASTLPTEATDSELNVREFQTAEHRHSALGQQGELLQGSHHADEIDPDVDGPGRRASESRLENHNA